VENSEKCRKELRRFVSFSHAGYNNAPMEKGLLKAKQQSFLQLSGYCIGIIETNISTQVRIKTNPVRLSIFNKIRWS